MGGKNFAYGKSKNSALMFIRMAEISDSTQQNAIITLVDDLKSNNLWDKMKAIYPFVGGTEFSHKWNLKDPRDLDAAFRIVFSPSFQNQSSLGLVCSTSGNLIDTKLNASTVLSLYNHHVSFYTQTDFSGTYADISCGNDTAPFMLIFGKLTDNSFDSRMYNTSEGRLTYSQSAESGVGLYLVTDTSQTSRETYKNGISRASKTDSQPLTSLPNDNFTIGMSTGAPYYSPRTYSFFTIGDGLNDTESANLYTIIQSYQTTLGRNV